VHFAGKVSALLKHPKTALASLRSTLGKADISMVNLETAITSRGTPAPKQYHFRTTPKALTALAAAGVDVVTMANNHAVDYGKPGLTDTLAAKKTSPVKIVGIGANASQAYAPAMFTVRGQKVAVLGASDVNDWTLSTWQAGAGKPGIANARSSLLIKAVSDARKHSDIVVVYLHWGTEGLTCPTSRQTGLAGQLKAAGADVVVGSHAHRVQGGGWKGSSFVDYGLGNFVWYNNSAGGSATTGVLTVSIVGRSTTTATWTPMVVSPSGVPIRPSAAVSAKMLKAWKAARGCTGLAAKP
jgi:poly-gamma-glutamate synthesis protein (capsule biosynthesis protein)